MRYVAEDEVGCDEWCGRPQFCKGTSLTPNDEWVSYMQKSALRRWQEAEGTEENEDLPSWARPQSFRCSYPYDEGSFVHLWNEVPPAETHAIFGAFQDCRVLHHKRDSKDLSDSELSFFDGVLSETEEIVPFFSASTSQLPWVYHFDHLEYIGETVIGGNTIMGPKSHYLSLFFTSSSAACDGKNKSQWSYVRAMEAFEGHVFMDDGSLEMRRAAFLPYHFTAICLDLAEESELLPQAVVDAVGFGTHPLVPSAIHKKLQRVFFHLPDAVQPFLRLHPLILEGYLEDMYNNPDKNDAMYYKQTFLFLMMELFRYRYRQDLQSRLQNFACALCQQQRLATEETGDVVVSVAFCLMSRRSGHALRHAIRQTWAKRLGPGSSLHFFVGAVTVQEDVADDLPDLHLPDMVELDAPEAYEAVTLKAMSMLHWAHLHFPHLRYLIRADDDVYLRPGPLLQQLEKRPPVGYLWGNFDSGSTVVRDPFHPHYNSEEQLPLREHPMFGDIFPPYVRGHLWAMSGDLLTLVSDLWKTQLEQLEDAKVTLDLAKRLPHPDDPALGVLMASLVDAGDINVAVDDRDLNHFALNPSCNATYLKIHNRTWVVHHVTPEAMECFWSIDEMAVQGELPDLCPCSMEVVEEKSGNSDDDDFDYPRERFNE
eukprot:symbB.v1.2.020585.t1/scaffold1691.1/size105682/2